MAVTNFNTVGSNAAALRKERIRANRPVKDMNRGTATRRDAPNHGGHVVVSVGLTAPFFASNAMVASQSEPASVFVLQAQPLIPVVPGEVTEETVENVVHEQLALSKVLLHPQPPSAVPPSL